MRGSCYEYEYNSCGGHCVSEERGAGELFLFCLVWFGGIKNERVLNEHENPLTPPHFQGGFSTLKH